MPGVRAATRSDLESDWLRQREVLAKAETPREGVGWALALAERTLAYVESSRSLPELGIELVALKKKAEILAGAPDADWQGLYLETRRLRRRIILSHPLLNFERLLVNKRPPTLYSHQCDQYLGRHSRPGPGLVVLSSWKDAPQERTILTGKLPVGSVLHPDVSFNAKRIMFSFCDHTIESKNLRRFLIYEAGLDGQGLRQLTGTPSDPMVGAGGRATVLIEDFDPCYLPDGGFAFISTRNQGYGRCHGGRYTPSYVLYRANGDGSGIRQISFGEANEWDPSILHDGRLIYTRWDYINRHDTIFQSLWVTRPDGSVTAHFYGNYTRNPCMQAEARAIPGSHKVVCTAMAHHSYTAGSLIVIDPGKGEDGLGPVERVTPEAPFPETEGWPPCSYATPLPITEDLFFAAYSPDRLAGQGGVQRFNAYGIYLVDTLGGRELVYRDPTISCFSPIPLRVQPRPPVIPSMLSPRLGKDTGILYVQDVYQSTQPIKRGTIKRLRVSRIISQPTARVPARSRAANEILKGIVGTVPVNPDGSVAFRAPAGEPLQFQLLDENGMAVMTMRSQVYLQGGEFTSCVGCHEPRHASPESGRMPEDLAVHEIEPSAGPSYEGGFSFVRTVQPVLDRHCIECHGLEETAGDVNLMNVRPKGGTGNAAYSSLTAGKRVSIAHRNSETYFSKPKDYFAHAGSLAKMLLAGHKDKEGRPRVKLDRESFQRIVDWLDLNAQFYGDYSHNRLDHREPPADAMAALRAHIRKVLGPKLGDQPTAALVNWVVPEESRVLNAPLAVSAGGWGQIRPEWPGTGDPGYKHMLALVRRAVGKTPTFYVAGTCGQDSCRCGNCWVRRARETMMLVRAVGTDSAAWVAKIEGSDPPERVRLLKMLTEHGWSPAYPAARQAMRDADQAVRFAAIAAAARLGRERALEPILEVLHGKQAVEREAAHRALVAMPGAKVSGALAGLIPRSEANVRILLLDILAARGAAEEAEAVIAAARDKEASVRLAAIRALGKLADDQTLPDLIELIAVAQGEERRVATESALAACSRVRNPDAAAEGALRAMPKASIPVRCSLLSILGKVGGKRSLSVLEKELTHEDRVVQTAAIRALGEWPDASPAELLASLAKSDRPAKQRHLAMRGHLLLLRRDGSLSVRGKLHMLESGMKMAPRQAEKRLAMDGIARISDPAALNVAQRYFGDASLGSQAEAAAVKIASAIRGSHYRQAYKAMQSLAGSTLDGGIRSRAKSVIEEIQVTHPSMLPTVETVDLFESADENDPLLDLDI